jgi:probable HAF family extracellular repeat protein
VLWDKDGSVHDLGTLGGTTTATAPAHGNIALSINNQGQIVGASLVADNTNVHPFLWTKEEGMRDLGTLPGDVSGAGLDINAAGAVVGPSVDEKGDLRAFVWQNGAMSDLNDLVPADFPLFLLLAVSINNHGDIVGFGVQKDEPHAIHAFLAAPDHGAIAAGESIVSAAPERIGERRNIALPENVRTVIRQRLAFGRIVAQPVRPQ